MLQDAPEIDTLVIPIGGGGLFSGMGTAARALKPDVRLVGVQAELYPSMYANVRGEDLPCEGDTLAEGIAVKQPGELTRKFVQALADDIVLVSERYLEQRSEEPTSELQSLMRISYAVYCLQKKTNITPTPT